MIKIEFKIDDAFKNGYGREQTAVILELIAKVVRGGESDEGIIRDTKGNRMGYWIVNS